MTSQVFLSLGTNLGRRQQNLQRAVDELGKEAVINALSPVYETAPWGEVDQPDFLNMCIEIETLLAPDALLTACKAIEKTMGRQPGPKWGPRLIDVDILIYDDLLLEDDRLTLPHPGLHARAFVLVPLADIAPDLIDPRCGRTVAQLLEQVDAGGVRPFEGLHAPLRKPARLAWGIRTFVMGILNITPDSFSGDGLLASTDVLGATVARAKKFADGGADILDIGGESTRPGSVPISQEEELQRLVPAIRAVRENINLPISVDTYRSAVAEAALESGADWVNDVWGFRMDPEMPALIAQKGCPVVLMHNRSKPKNAEQRARLGGRYVGIDYADLFGEIMSELQESIDLALTKGVLDSQIVIDPGIGFGKTTAQNLELLKHLGRLRELGYPILVGTSRKSFIGYSLGLPPDQRLEGTAATVAIAVDRGADMVRVHDVEAMVRVVRMTDRIVRA